MSVAHETVLPAAAPVDWSDDRRRHLDEVWANQPFAEAVAETERLCAVLPLLELFDDDPYGAVARVRTGGQRAALGLFTPNAWFSLSVPAIRGRDGEDGRVSLTGRFRYAVTDAEASLVALAVEGEDALRLALLPHRLDGIRLHGAGHARGWGWGELDGAVVGRQTLSRPVTWAPDGPLVPVFDGYAWEFSRRSVTWSAEVVAELRRELAATSNGTDALSTSQYLAHELSKLEIEISLAATAASFGPGLKGEQPGGQSVAAVLLACTDLLRRTVRTAEDLSTELGLPGSRSASGTWPTDVVQACFGGRRMVGSELARRMNLVPEAARP